MDFKVPLCTSYILHMLSRGTDCLLISLKIVDPFEGKLTRMPCEVIEQHVVTYVRYIISVMTVVVL